MRIVTSLLCLVLAVSPAFADKKSRGRGAWAWSVATQPSQATNAKPGDTATGECKDALDEVNKERAKRGLTPFQRDDALTKAAYAAAKERAGQHIYGHLANDFDYLPTGARADSAGCGALEPSWGWGTCCTYDDYSHAGAAWVAGNDGRRYMHLFVRNAIARIESAPPQITMGSCFNGSCSMPGGIITRGRRGR